MINVNGLSRRGREADEVRGVLQEGVLDHC